MGRHRNDPQGLARVLMVGLAVIVALGLVVVGGTALFETLNSKSGNPTESVSP